MPRVSPAILALAIALPGAGQAQAQQQQPAPSLDLSRDTGCTEPTSGEVVVCGERGRSQYRIDPTTLETMRQQEALKNPDRIASRDLPPQACGVGADICAGGMIPIFQPALKVVSAIVNAVQGDDWREPFRTGPDEYELYRQQKAKTDGVSVGISAGN